jgi:hypothetical protein
MWGPAKANGLGLKKPGMPPTAVSQFAASPAKHGQWRDCLMERSVLDTAPEFPQARQAIRYSVAGNQACVDCPYGGTDRPVRLDACIVQRLINADLVGSQSTAALQHQNDLADIWIQRGAARTRLVNHRFTRNGLCFDYRVIPIEGRRICISPA